VSAAREGSCYYTTNPLFSGTQYVIICVPALRNRNSYVGTCHLSTDIRTEEEQGMLNMETDNSALKMQRSHTACHGAILVIKYVEDTSRSLLITEATKDTSVLKSNQNKMSLRERA
jgi:hypothetical protein